MENQKQQVLERLQQANNVLVTVSNNPSVDQLSAAIGLTLFLTKLDKHATAVFSGAVPSTIDFLKPDKTIEKTTDSLRDFIISLDKSKADKLRYKVEDQHVKVFITPYRTSITEDDLVFSQGDFNVDAVVAIGVNDQKDLDQAITAHGRILHDATVISVTTDSASTLGTINWANAQASSLCEMIADLSESLKANNLDGQMATAYLTGIVAETARFSNEKTSAATMTVSARLMAAGANQQLVATELQKQDQPSEVTTDVSDNESPNETDQPDQPPSDEASHDGTLEIGHNEPSVELPPVDVDESAEPIVDQIDIDDDGEVKQPTEADGPETPPSNDQDIPRVAMTEPPQLGGVLTASGRPEDAPANIDLLAGGQDEPLLSHDAPVNNEPPQPPLDLPALVPEVPISTGDTLADLEQTVGSPHVVQQQLPPEAGIDSARSAVYDAIAQNPDAQALPPIDALNAQPVDLDVLQVPSAHTEPDFSLPPGLIPEDTPSVDTTATSVENPTAPPPVPPPMMPDLNIQPGLLPDDDRPLPPLPDEQLPPAAPGQGDQNNPFGLPPA